MSEFKHVLIMKIGKTSNGLDITKSMMYNSIETFGNIPISYSKKQETDTYEEIFSPSFNVDESIIGMTLSKNIEINNYGVYVDILIFDKYNDLWKGKIDNWSIIHPINHNYNIFKLYSLEVY